MNSPLPTGPWRSNASAPGTPRNPLSFAAWLTLAVSIVACGQSTPAPPGADQSDANSPRTARFLPATPDANVRSAIRGLLADSGPDAVGSVQERASLASIYPTGAEPLLWLDKSLSPTEPAQVAIAALRGAAIEGLDIEDYGGEALMDLGASFGSQAPASPRDIAAFDVGVSLSLMRYLRQMHRGRVDPEAIGFLLNLPKDEHDYAALVREAATLSRVKEIIASLTPPLVQYQLLRSLLPRYRALALNESRKTLPSLPEPPARPIKPGESAEGLDPLRLRLIALGDLSPDAATPAQSTLYDGEIVLAVKRFQARHGLEDDGVLGPTTWRVLQVPMSWRYRQVELAMERMRWLPHLGERAFVAVNVPMFRLWAWDSVPATGAPLFSMGVIVGKALDTRTPVFLEEMEYLIFRPYWNVPRSILEEEILPILRRDLGYLERQEMEMVEGQTDEARPLAPTRANVDRLAKRELRLRQRPGGKNALGDVKFIFPNDENVYLHSTPAPVLFGRARRDLSHGCVRVEDPVRLAQLALSDQPEWTREKIVAAMTGTPSQRVPLTRKIRVVLYYVTATVIPGEGSVHFAEDIYKQDPILDKALAGR